MRKDPSVPHPPAPDPLDRLLRQTLADARPEAPHVDAERLAAWAAKLVPAEEAAGIEQHLSHQALRRSEARTRAILRAIPDWMFLMSADGVFLDYHARDVTELAAAPSDFLGKNVRDILPAPVAEEIAQAFTRVMRTDEPVKVEYALGSDAGQRFYEARIVRCDGDKGLVERQCATTRRVSPARARFAPHPTEDTAQPPARRTWRRQLKAPRPESAQHLVQRARATVFRCTDKARCAGSAATGSSTADRWPYAAGSRCVHSVPSANCV